MYLPLYVHLMHLIVQRFASSFWRGSSRGHFRRCFRERCVTTDGPHRCFVDRQWVIHCVPQNSSAVAAAWHMLSGSSVRTIALCCILAPAADGCRRCVWPTLVSDFVNCYWCLVLHSFCLSNYLSVILIWSDFPKVERSCWYLISSHQTHFYVSKVTLKSI